VGDQERSWIELRIGITPDEAIEFLDALAEDEDLRTRLEQNPREVLLKHHIDFLPATAPGTLRLPPHETIADYAQKLREREPFGRDTDMPHGYAVLWVAHGNFMWPRAASS